MNVKEIENKMLEIDMEYNRNTARLHAKKISWNEWDKNATNLYNEYKELELKLKQF